MNTTVTQVRWRRYAPCLDKRVSVEEPVPVILVVTQAGSDGERGDCNGAKEISVGATVVYQRWLELSY